MTGTTARRWRKLSDQLSATIDGVPADRWDDPTPCEGWRARDVVQHLTEWMPGLYLGGPVPGAPAAADDPGGAWRAVDAAIYAELSDPERAARPTSSPAGEMSLEQLVAMTGIGDLLVHRWDLARATGQDERLDPDEVHGALAGIDPAMSEPMVASGHFKAPIEVDPGADDQTRLLAFFGRRN